MMTAIRATYSDVKLVKTPALIPMVRLCCPICEVSFDRLTGHVNRSRKAGMLLYCGRPCAGIGRRKHRTIDEKKRLKAAYDKKRRHELGDELRAKKAEYYQRTKHPVKEAVTRKARAHLHREYCQRPAYVRWKARYDRKRRARQAYGSWAECFLLTQDIRGACLDLQSDYEIRQAAGTLNKAQQRRREYEKLNSGEPKAGPLGHPG